MRKLLAIVSTIGLASTAALTTISCRAPRIQGANGHRAVLMTNGTALVGNAFNEGAVSGMVDWGKSVNEDLSNNYITPVNMLTSTLESSYLLAKDQKVNSLILNGNIFDATLANASKAMKDGSIIWIDGSQTNYSNVISVKFKSELSGFKAGYNAVEYAYNHKKEMGIKDKISFGMFGGMSVQFGVNDYMWGFLVGIKSWMHAQTNLNEKDLENEITIANEGKGWNFTGSNQVDWFSGNFDSDSIGADTMIKTLKGANIMFPVAGPQISQVLSSPYGQYVIGVDTDQVDSFVNYKAKFLTSALKNVEKAVSDELARSRGLNDVNGNPYTDVDDGKVISDPTWSSIGVSDNNLIKQSDYDQKIEGDTWTKISEALITKYDDPSNVNVSDYLNGNVVEQMSVQIANIINGK